LSGLSGAAVANGKMAFPFTVTGTLQNPKFTLKSAGADGQSGAINGALKGQKGNSSQQPANPLQGLGGLIKKKK
jgi:hypothetical protein